MPLSIERRFNVTTKHQRNSLLLAALTAAASPTSPAIAKSGTSPGRTRRLPAEDEAQLKWVQVWSGKMRAQEQAGRNIYKQLSAMGVNGGEDSASTRAALPELNKVLRKSLKGEDSTGSSGEKGGSTGEKRGSLGKKEGIAGESGRKEEIAGGMTAEEICENAWKLDEAKQLDKLEGDALASHLLTMIRREWLQEQLKQIDRERQRTVDEGTPNLLRLSTPMLLRLKRIHPMIESKLNRILNLRKDFGQPK